VTSECVVPGDSPGCGELKALAKAYGVDPRRMLADIVASVAHSYSMLPGSEGPSYSGLLSLLAAGPALLRAFEYLLFRGFQRLLELMALEDVDCYSRSEGAGCREPAGFTLALGAMRDEAPTSLTLGVGYPADDPAVLFVEAEASITTAGAEAPDEEPDEAAVEAARRAARRTISYAKRTRLYRSLADYLAEAGESWWDLSLEPGDEVDEGIPAVSLRIEAAAPPGLLLPFNLNPLLDLSAYIARRLGQEYRKLAGKRG